MSRYKILLLTWFVAIVMLLNKVFLYTKTEKVNDFYYFVREYLNHVYSKDMRNIQIDKFIAIASIYFLIYFIFYATISVNIESFKHIIKYNSKNVLDYYAKSIKFFTKIFLKMAIFNVVVIVGVFRIFFDYTNYLLGILDLVKLPLYLYLALLVGVIFKIKKVVLAGLIYLVIVMYILYLNSMSLVVVFGCYAVTFLIFIFRLIFSKIDV